MLDEVCVGHHSAYSARRIAARRTIGRSEHLDQHVRRAETTRDDIKTRVP